jgi:hypothetical protein
MTKTTQTLQAETGGTDITRFNALRHGVLSRYTVLRRNDRRAILIESSLVRRVP